MKQPTAKNRAKNVTVPLVGLIAPPITTAPGVLQSAPPFVPGPVDPQYLQMPQLSLAPAALLPAVARALAASTVAPVTPAVAPATVPTVEAAPAAPTVAPITPAVAPATDGPTASGSGSASASGGPTVHPATAADPDDGWLGQRRYSYPPPPQPTTLRIFGIDIPAHPPSKQGSSGE